MLWIYRVLKIKTWCSEQLSYFHIAIPVFSHHANHLGTLSMSLPVMVDSLMLLLEDT